MDKETKLALLLAGLWFGVVIGIIIMMLFLILASATHAEWKSIGVREITSFHAVRAECDNEPDIGAHGRVAINGAPTGKWAACNFLPFHTRLKIPKVSGNMIWTVIDRTAPKCGHRVDLLYPIGSSLKGGLVKVEVFIEK